MIRNIIRTAAAYIANTAYEDGRRDGAGLVPRRELEEARAALAKAIAERDEAVDATLRHLDTCNKRYEERDALCAELEAVKADRDRILRELGANLGNAPEPGEIKRRVSELYAERDEAHRGELHALDSRGKVIADRDAWKARAEKAEAALASQPAAHPWTDEALDSAMEVFWKEFDGAEPELGRGRRALAAALATLAPPPQAVTFDAKAWVDKHVTVGSRTSQAGQRYTSIRIFGHETDAAYPNPEDVCKSLREEIVASLPTQAPPQAAPVPPVGVGDVWGDAWRDVVRVVYNEAEDQYELHVGNTMVRWFNSRSDADEESRLVRLGLASLTPMRVGDVWGDAVRVVFVTGDRLGYRVLLGDEVIFHAHNQEQAEWDAKRIRRGLASLPPLRAVLVGGVTEEMLEAYTYKQAWARYEASGDGRPFTMDECKAAGLTAALAAANIRVLGPGEGVVRVRVCEAGEKCPSGSVYRLPTSHWYGSGAGGSVCETSEAWYILAADLDAAAAGVGKGGANG